MFIGVHGLPGVHAFVEVTSSEHANAQIQYLQMYGGQFCQGNVVEQKACTIFCYSSRYTLALVYYLCNISVFFIKLN